MNRKPPRYIIDPPEVQARVTSKTLARVAKQMAKWTPVSYRRAHKDNPDGFCGNVRPNWDKARNRFVFLPEQRRPDWERFPLMSSVISSAMLLYRTLCLFGAPVRVVSKRNQYKCIWWISLRHKESGEILQLGEWKGAAGTWTKYHSSTELPKTFRQDTLLLLNELCSPDCPHPYDGLVAGSVA
jgi:hypothetical protein